MLAAATIPFVDLDIVLVVVPPGQEDSVRDLLTPHLPPSAKSRVHYTTGGRTRQESVRRGLQWLASRKPDWVLIHDGARPWVSQDLVDCVLATTRDHGACVPVVPLHEAPKLVDETGSVIEHLERGRVRCAQTPQGFAFEPVLDAHLQASRSSRAFHDDAAVWDAFVGPVISVEGERENAKITYPEDLPEQ